MPPRYAPKTVLRNTSNALLARFFHERDLLIELDIASMAETSILPVFDAWQALDEERRVRVDADLTEINRLAHEGGEQAMIDEGHFHDVDFVPVFEELDGFHDRAMLVFLDHPRIFEVASFFNESDTRPQKYWRGRKGVPRVAPSDDELSCRRLGAEMSAYLRKAEGRGNQCHVEPYLRGSKVYFFAYPEDYGAVHMEYHEGRFERRQVRPAFEVIFVYEKERGTLDLYFEGSVKRVSELQEIFGRTILGTTLGAVPGSDRVFELNKLKRRSFDFVYGAASGIIDVRIKKIRFTAIGAVRERITLEADTSRKRDQVYDLLDRQFQTDREPVSSVCSKMPLNLTNITQVRIEVSFAPSGKRRPTKTFDLSYPNACPLGHEGRDALIRQMLIDSGIEPQFDLAAS